MAGWQKFVVVRVVLHKDNARSLCFAISGVSLEKVPWKWQGKALCTGYSFAHANICRTTSPFVKLDFKNSKYMRGLIWKRRYSPVTPKMQCHTEIQSIVAAQLHQTSIFGLSSGAEPRTKLLTL